MDDALTVRPLPINEVRWSAVLAGMAYPSPRRDDWLSRTSAGRARGLQGAL